MQKASGSLWRAGTLALAVMMLSIAVFKAQACQSAPPAPEEKGQFEVTEPQTPEPAPPQTQPAPVDMGASPDMTSASEDMGSPEHFFPATKSGAFMFKSKPKNP